MTALCGLRRPGSATGASGTLCAGWPRRVGYASLLTLSIADADCVSFYAAVGKRGARGEIVNSWV